MSADRFIKINVNRSVATLSQVGFGNLLAVYQVDPAIQPERTVTYTSAQELSDSALPQNIKDALETVFLQSPTIGRVTLGRRNPGTAQTVSVTVTAGTTDGTYQFDLEGETVQYLALATESAEEIAQGLRADALLKDANVTISETDGNGTFTITASIAGQTFTADTESTSSDGTTVLTETQANGPAEDLSDALDAIEAAGDESYGLVIENRDDASILEAAEWTQARRRLFSAQTEDENLRDGIDGNIADQLAQLGFSRTRVEYNENSDEHTDIALMSKRLSLRLDEEQGTWAFVQLAGITPSNELAGAQITNIEAGPANTYTRCGVLNVTNPGVQVTGLFTDQVTTEDWLVTRLEQAIFNVLAGSPRGVPFTRAGVALIEAAIRGVLIQGENVGHFQPGSTNVTLPDPNTLSSAQRQSRCLPDVQVTAVEAGFLHCINVSVSITA